MSEPVTFTPDTPPVHNGKSYPVLSMRKMKAKDLVSADLVAGDTRKVFAVIASMADVPIQVIEDLDGDDYDRLEELVKPLMGKSMRAMVEARGRRMEDMVEAALKEAMTGALAGVVKA